MELHLTFRTSPDSLEKMRHNFKAFEDTTEKIEIEIREMKEKLSSLTTTAEKSRDEG